MPKKSNITVILPNGTRKVLEGVSEPSKVPLTFLIEVADALGLPGIRESVTCYWYVADAQHGDDPHTVRRNRVFVSRGVQTGPNRIDYTSGVFVGVERVKDRSA